MNRILVVFAHPALEKSRVHIALMKAIERLPNITFNDLYEEYPEFNVDINREKRLLLDHDIIIWQHPFYWYSGPALLKQWIDLVLEHGWAYGKHGNQLKNKIIFNAVSSGGGEDIYQASGMQGITMQELLIPFKKTAALCHMKYLPPFWVPGSHRMVDEQIQAAAMQYKRLLLMLREGQFDYEHLASRTHLNEIPLPLNQ